MERWFGVSMLVPSRKRITISPVLVWSLAFGAIGVVTPSAAHAHFKLNAPASWMSQDSVGGPQKNGPCAAVANTSLGDSAGTPTKIVTVLQAGQTVPVSVTATVAHPGWFRIALVEGASSSQSLSTLADPKAQTGTNCTPAIISSPVWSSTQPVLADGLPAGSTASTQQTGTQTFQVIIPKTATCTSARPCTLQVIMVMTDHPASDCYYHHCADISTEASADAGSDSASVDALVARDAANAARDASGAGGSGTGGDLGSGGATSTGGGAGAGGVSAKGGSTASGGATPSGGGASGGSAALGAGGEGGANGGGGSNTSGGITSAGGGTSAGGVSGGIVSGGDGGVMGTAGSARLGGGTGTGSGGSRSGSTSGCDVAAFGGSSPVSLGFLVALLGAMVALRGRWRRCRSVL
jgi:hypothetical protein